MLQHWHRHNRGLQRVAALCTQQVLYELMLLMILTDVLSLHDTKHIHQHPSSQVCAHSTSATALPPLSFDDARTVRGIVLCLLCFACCAAPPPPATHFLFVIKLTVPSSPGICRQIHLGALAAMDSPTAVSGMLSSKYLSSSKHLLCIKQAPTTYTSSAHHHHQPPSLPKIDTTIGAQRRRPAGHIAACVGLYTHQHHCQAHILQPIRSRHVYAC